MKIKKYAIILALSFALLGQSLWAADNKFLSVADIHFDPFLGCPTTSDHPCLLIEKLRKTKYQNWASVFVKYGHQSPSHYYQDTNYPLFKLALTGMQTQTQHIKVQFGLILGDFLAHEFHEKYQQFSKDKTPAGYRNFVKKTLQFMTYEIRKSFPTLDFYPAIGNNDSYKGDYKFSEPHGKFLEDTTQTWSNLINNKQNKAHFQQDFPQGGYYAVQVPGHENQKILVLNTVFFSSKASDKQIDAAAQHQLQWLHQQLQSAVNHKQKVMLAFHVPTGVDVYATLINKFDAIHQFWKMAYNKEFENELNEFHSIISVILPAHIHTDSSQFITLKNYSVIPAIFTPSVSPIFGNDPGFKIFVYNADTFKLVNFNSFFYPLSPSLYFHDWQKKFSLRNTEYDSK